MKTSWYYLRSLAWELRRTGDLVIDGPERSAFHRAAMSRCYHAAFHAIRSAAPAHLMQGRSSDHGRLLCWLEVEVGAGSDALHTLRSLRNVADYDLNEDFDPADLDRSLAYADSLIARFGIEP
mgnify:CR=1 FL=1